MEPLLNFISRLLLEIFWDKCRFNYLCSCLDVLVFLSQNRYMTCGNRNLLSSSERLFRGARDDEGYASSNVAWDSDCKRSRFIVKRWWHSRCHPVFSRSTSERKSGINLHVSSIQCLECFFFQYSISYTMINFEVFTWGRFTHYNTCKVANIWYLRCMENRTLIRWQPLPFLTTTSFWFITFLLFFMYTDLCAKIGK